LSRDRSATSLFSRLFYCSTALSRWVGSVHKVTRPVQPSHLVPGLEFPCHAALPVEQRDLAVYDALLAEMGR
jgi:hypothetical protein